GGSSADDGDGGVWGLATGGGGCACEVGREPSRSPLGFVALGIAIGALRWRRKKKRSPESATASSEGRDGAEVSQ
ncbi:MAG: MYXO-CTERM sorting domain-containing protein, partial [Polyangiaceae bacterium]|nr:MYXO-CTERM sorting domain-containing protein [Polyangiaceae bacterium]